MMSNLQALAAKARKHWAEYLPEKTRELKEEGIFESESLAAARLTLAEMETLKLQGYREHEAEEAALPLFILLKEEPPIP